MLKVILFDVDNTLLSFDEYVKESMRSGFAEFAIGPYEEGMFEVFLEINTGLWRQIETGEIDFEELQKIRWNRIFERLGYKADGIRFEQYFRECLFESAIPERGAMELLEYLHGKYTLGVASNGPYLQQVNRLKISGMLPYFSDLFISEEIGSPKPSREFFDTCLSRLNAKAAGEILPAEIMMVGDSLSSDMAGGRACGMQTCFYNPAQRDLPAEAKVNYTVTALEQLKTIL